MENEENDVTIDDIDSEESSPSEAKAVPYERFKEVNDKYKELKQQFEQPKEPLPAKEQEPQSSGFSELAKNVSLIRNLSDDEIVELETTAKDLGVPPEKFAQSKAWQAQLATTRASKKVEDTAPPSSSSAYQVEGKTWAQMTREERANNFSSVMQGKKHLE